MDNLTPVMKQYMEVKEQYKDMILFFRLGDFYEMFFDDAETASKELEIVLTSRNCGNEGKAPMCGVPFHSADSYIARLVSLGYKVAICEQLETPKGGKGLVKRDVVRVVTAGTIMDSSVLDAKKNNYICSVYRRGEAMGLAFADLGTGKMCAKEISGGSSLELITAAMTHISEFSPAEAIANLEAYEDGTFLENMRTRFDCFVQNFYNWSYEPDVSVPRVAEHFKGNHEVLEQLRERELITCAMGGLLQYLEETQKSELSNLKHLDIIKEHQYMEIDIYTKRNLELVETIRSKHFKGSLLWVLDKTKTDMGGRLMHDFVLHPLLNCAQIQKRHNAVSELLENPVFRQELTDNLKEIKDLERLLSRIVYGTANPREVKLFGKSLKILPALKGVLQSGEAELLNEIFDDMDVLEELSNLVERAINDSPPHSVREGGIIKLGYHDKIDNLRSAIDNGAQWISEEQQKERDRTGIKNLKIKYNRVFGYYIEVAKSFEGQLPEDYMRKQTLANCERYFTPRLKEIEEIILTADTEIVALEYELYCKVMSDIAKETERIQKTSRAVALLDVLCSLAHVAECNNYVCPVVNMSDRIEIKGGRHPVVEHVLKDKLFVPNDTVLDNGENLTLIITGPNMAGKSTYMRQVALITLLAQIGSFVPASYAEIGIVDKIFTRVGASDDLASGQSTFMVEMIEVAHILNNATNKSLLVLDEIGRGTSTYDGLSIAWAVVEHICDKKKLGAKTLFATHYKELTDLENKMKNVKNYCIAVKKRGYDITFLRKIVRGGADDSFGIAVANLAGVKRSVVDRASEIVTELESHNINNEVNIEAPKSVAADCGAERRGLGDGQISLMDSAAEEVAQRVREIDLNVLTPIEALGELYELQKKLK